jgi:hypothetical protein
MNDHELGFTSFLAEPVQRRVRTLLELGPKRRKQVRALLEHSIMLDPRYAQPLAGREASAQSVQQMLRSHGAPPTCYLISADEKLDGREMPLRDAVDAVAGSLFGGFISCIPGKLGYFEYEDIQSGHLLRR